MAKMREDELQELQNPESWEDPGEVIHPTKSPRAVVSVGFSREDFEAIVEQARKRGMKTSEFIRRAALDATTPKQQEAAIVSVTGAVYTGYVSVVAPRVKTEVSTTPEPVAYATA